jgi:hypothetical protein
MATRALKCFEFHVRVPGTPRYQKAGQIPTVHAESAAQAKRLLRQSGFVKAKAVFPVENPLCKTPHTDQCCWTLLAHGKRAIHAEPVPPETPPGYMESLLNESRVDRAARRQQKMLEQMRLD